MYKLNLRGYMLAVAGRALVIVAGYLGSVPLMLLFTAVAALGQGPWQGDMNAGHRILLGIYLSDTGKTCGWNDVFLYFPCIKIGGGIGTALVGWLLEVSGYVGTAATQPASSLRMLSFMYLWLPLVFEVLIMLVLSRMNVEETVENIKREKGIASDCVTDEE